MILNYTAAQKRRDQQGIRNNLLEAILHDIKQTSDEELTISPNRPLIPYEVRALRTKRHRISNYLAKALNR